VAPEREQLDRLAGARRLARESRLRRAQQHGGRFRRGILEREPCSIERRRGGEIRPSGSLRRRAAAREGVRRRSALAGSLLEIAEIVQRRGDQPGIAARFRCRPRPLERAARRVLLSGGEVGLAEQPLERGGLCRMGFTLARAAQGEQPVECQLDAAGLQIRCGLRQDLIERIRERRAGPDRARQKERQQQAKEPSSPISQTLDHGAHASAWP
jgi:hypothetical protein